MALRRAGASYQQIAEALDVSTTMAHRYVKQALEAMREETRETAEDVRQLELARLDEMLSRLWPKVTEGDMKAYDRALRIMERRSKLLGLDAPKRHHHEGSVDHELQISKADVDELEETWRRSIDGEAVEIPEVELIESGDEGSG